MRFDGNQGRTKNYEPNSFDGPKQAGAPLWASIPVEGSAGSHAPVRHRDGDNLVKQATLIG